MYSFRIIVSNDNETENTSESCTATSGSFCELANSVLILLTRRVDDDYHNSAMVQLIIVVTTDVQMVTVTINQNKTATLHCEFMVGSNARGCIVVLSSSDDAEENHNLTRESDKNEVISTLTLMYAPPCYRDASAYDIESDGSIGNITVPGKLQVNGGRDGDACPKLSE